MVAWACERRIRRTASQCISMWAAIASESAYFRRAAAQKLLVRYVIAPFTHWKDLTLYKSQVCLVVSGMVEKARRRLEKGCFEVRR